MALGYQDTLSAVNIILNSNNVPSIVGEAGVGKSALVENLANINKAKLFTTVVSLSEKGDLSIPVPPLTDKSFINTKDYGTLADVQYGYSHTLIEIIKYAENNPQTSIYWFLDEFNRGSNGVQSELMNLVLQRKINSLKLPKQVKIIIAENPDSTMDGFENSEYSVFSSDSAIKDRTTRIVMNVNVSDWLLWAKSKNKQGYQNISSVVITYIENNQNMLIINNNDNDINPTPRAWQRVSDIIENSEYKNVGYDIKFDLIAGNVGSEVASNFLNFTKNYFNSLSVSQLFSDNLSKVINRFKQLDEFTKNKLLKQMINKVVEWKPVIAKRFNLLLDELSPDGQYGISIYIANNTEVLQEIYSKIDDSSNNDLKLLYTHFQNIILSIYR
ncbi:P-loop NTPase family protein [Apilactobacillus quenuiae]|uniref:ATP-binding protein n=1 Tax=Apilactobacillus quenuiae TaxID=2008377 RepID=UPI001CDAECEF|nr:ATP-binding protein [Apilactobacillus quenuiae]